MEGNTQHTANEVDIKSLGLRYGLIGGLVTIVYSLIRYLIDVDIYLAIGWSMASYLIVIASMVTAGVVARKALNGEIAFKQALQGTFLAAVISLTMWGAFAFALGKYYDTNIPKFTKNKTLAFTEKVMVMSGASEEEIEAALDNVEKQSFEQTFGQFVMGLFGQFVVAFIYALIISAVFSMTSKPEPEQHLDA